MVVVNAQRFRPSIIIPTDLDGYVKITITDDSGVVHTVMDSYGGASTNNHTISANISRTATDSLGSFKLTIANDLGRWLDKFNGGELVKFYADYTNATTLIFAGLIDDPRYALNLSNGFHMVLDGRGYPELNDKTITGTEVSVKADVSIAGILHGFYDDITLMFWNSSSWSEATYTYSSDSVSWSPTVSNFPTTLLNMTYQNKKGWSVIKEICKKAGLDAYIEYDETNSRWTLRLAVEEAITNSEVSVGYGINLTSLGSYGPRNSEIYNRVIVYGQTESDNILLLKTEEDSTSQSNLWIKDRIFDESDLTTMTEVQSKADLELAQNTSLPNSGRLSTLFMPSLRPGEKVYVTIPYCNINGYHRVQSFTHNFGTSFSTSIDIEKADRKLSELFIQKTNPDDFITPISNPNAMKDSYTVYFDESPSVMLHNNTEESNDALRLSVGQTSGTATSNTLITDYNVTSCELRKCENYDVINDIYEVSNNGGVSWENYVGLALTPHIFTGTGNLLKFRITLNRTNAGDTSPAYDSICLLYK